ncbi:MAG: DUF1853 family protein [Verrucomicrobiota bacterium]
MEFGRARFEADLRWLLECPTLLESAESFPLAEPPASSCEWSAVERFLETRAAHRVGYYVESLVQSWLESEKDIAELQHGIQVRREKETLGELDFLFRRRDKLHHLEVAMKFYLYYPDGAENGSRFIGPNARDSFEKKRDRLLQKQLPFGRESFPDIQESSHWVKGLIFYHPEDSREIELPDLLNEKHARGNWIRRAELDEYLSGWPPGRRGRILKKPYWLFAHGEDLPVTRILSAAEEHFDRWDGPVFLAGVEEGREVERLFVMPDFWPDALVG